MSVFFYIAIFSFVFLCVMLCFVILIQESKSTGLGSALGGGEAGESLFGTATADVLKRFTAYLVAIFLVSCVVLSLWTSASEHVKRKASPVIIEQAG